MKICIGVLLLIFLQAAYGGDAPGNYYPYGGVYGYDGYDFIYEDTDDTYDDPGGLYDDTSDSHEDTFGGHDVGAVPAHQKERYGYYDDTGGPYYDTYDIGMDSMGDNDLAVALENCRNTGGTVKVTSSSPRVFECVYPKNQPQIGDSDSHEEDTSGGNSIDSMGDNELAVAFCRNTGGTAKVTSFFPRAFECVYLKNQPQIGDSDSHEEGLENTQNCELFDYEGDAALCTVQNASHNKLKCPYLACFTQQEIELTTNLIKKELEELLDKAKIKEIQRCQSAVKTYKAKCVESPSQINANGNTARAGSAELCSQVKQVAEQELEADTNFVSKCEEAYVEFFGDKCLLSVSKEVSRIAEFNGQVIKEITESGTRYINENNTLSNEVDALRVRVVKRSNELDISRGKIQEAADKCLATFKEPDKDPTFAEKIKQKSEKYLKKVPKLLEKHSGKIEKYSGKIKKWLAKKDLDDKDNKLAGGSGVKTNYDSVYIKGQSNNAGETISLSSGLQEDAPSYGGGLDDQHLHVKSSNSKPITPKHYNEQQASRNTPSVGVTGANLFTDSKNSKGNARKVKRRRGIKERKLFNGYKVKNLKPSFLGHHISIPKKTDFAIYGKKRLRKRLEEAQDKFGKNVPLAFVNGKFVQAFLAEQEAKRKLARTAAVGARKWGKSILVFSNGEIATDINPNMMGDIFRQINFRYQQVFPEEASRFDLKAYKKGTSIRID